MLPDEVRKAVERTDAALELTEPNHTVFVGNKAAWQTIRAHLLAREAEVGVLRVKCAGSLANNLCPDHRDKQVGKPCLACTIERAEKRAERDEALLREALGQVLSNIGLMAMRNVTDGSIESAKEIHARITAHLSENSREV